MHQRPGDRIARRPRAVAMPVRRGRFAITAEPAHHLASRLLRYGTTVLVLAGVTAALWPLRQTIGLLNIGLIYLVVVVGATVFAGRWAGVLASLLGFALFDF